MTNIFPFIPDENCYNPSNNFKNNGSLIEASLNIFLEEHFIKDNLQFQKKQDDNFYGDIFKECKEKALNDNKGYFLIEDFSYNNENGEVFNYNCYIPKQNIPCGDINGSFEDYFSPLNSVINTLIGEEENRYNDICSNELTNLNNYHLNFNEEKKCIKYKKNVSSTILPRKHKFVLYKTDFIDNSEFNREEIDSYDSHYDLLNSENLDNNFENILDDIKRAMIRSLEINSTIDYNNIIDEVKKLDNFYNHFIIENSNELTNDISSISLLTKNDTLYLNHLENKIEENNRKLKNLFGVDGANNGKNLDIKYMKNLKLNEIIIISLLLIFLIYIYSKKK